MLIKHIADPVSERTAPSPVISNTTNMASNTGSPSTTQYTPSSTPSTVRYRDPDYPLPSIERDTTSTSAYSQSNTPLLPSVSPHAEALRQGSEYGSLDQRLQNLELHSVHPQRSISSPENTASQRERSIASPTPSIHVTPTASATYSHHSTANAGIEGLAHGVSALQTSPSHRRAQSAQPNNHLRHDSVDGSRAIRHSTASPSRRRRSSSGINRSTHRVEDEEPPQALFHERRIQEALTNARNVTGRLARVLSEANLHQEQGSSIQSMCQHAIRLSTFEPPSRRIVGLVGDSGVGKSSLINSLLDKVEFARASNSGAACTCVVTEYHFHDRDDYSIDIDYFTVQELRTQFEQLLSAYREHESTTEDDVRQAMRQKADLAKSTFQASFRYKLDDDPELLGTLPFDQAINKMMVWVLEVVPGLDTRDRDTRESFEDINQCSNRLRILTSDTEERDQACLWPFIRKLKVHMKAYILSKGLILADLPGLRDLNYARQNVTERYIRQCDQLFAITRIGRATTDAGVQEVFELARRASLSNVGVVCTQSDDIRLSEANNDWPDERVTISGMEEDIARKQRELASLNEDIDELNDLLLRSTDDAQELLELLRERDRVMKSLDGSEFELRRHIITVRNRRVCSDLQRRYSTHPDLQIFCVSNTIYSQERNKPVQESLPFLNLSGILGLRRYCIGIVAESHLRASTEYIKNEIPALLGSVELWIQAASVNTNAERKQQITDAVSVIQSELDGLTSPVSRISDITDQITSSFDDQLQQYMSAF
ncbi:hypothetical protein BGW36DRAFT_392225 [Talaromyces proteolyticus]|uniref:Dynamin N-terminal domain-containing protein n=1 Tax=Talaromyces proteolyticus TaxID=1131652 RepID=A0AAD4KD59_9EURO|nr:uncharacterized protein BGW36DRAFT_392225 [Talaromyces proteolyticus]KAH8688821.1 hypothetical protein BGW36DRAFT_392225 [Talaromyces proteolyticus]